MVDQMVYWTAILCIAIAICMARELINSVRDYGKANENN